MTEIKFNRAARKLLPVFTSPYDQYAERNGQTFEVLYEVDRNTFDYYELGPMFKIRFSDGIEIIAWPEEIADIGQGTVGINSVVGFDTEDDSEANAPCNP